MRIIIIRYAALGKHCAWVFLIAGFGIFGGRSGGVVPRAAGTFCRGGSRTGNLVPKGYRDVQREGGLRGAARGECGRGAARGACGARVEGGCWSRRVWGER